MLSARTSSDSKKCLFMSHCSTFFSMAAYKTLMLLRYVLSRIDSALTDKAKSCLPYSCEYCYCLSRIWLKYVIYFYGLLISLEQGDRTLRKKDWELAYNQQIELLQSKAQFSVAR